MALQMTRTDEEAQIRGLLEDWAKAARAKDVDAIAQLQFEGSDAYRKHWDACMAMCSGPMIFEVHELLIEAGDDLAFGHYLSRCGGTGPDGKERSGWMRATFCCRKTNGRWKIAHEHFSAPFDPESGKVLDLQP